MSHTILIVSPLKKMSGNYSTAVRLWNHFASRGHTCLLEETRQFSDCQKFSEYLRKNKIEFIISLHAYHSGWILNGCNVPYVLILGGTDVHEYTRDADKLQLMTAVIRKARKIVAFGRPLAEEVLHKWPTVNWSHIRVIPQAVSTTPSSFCVHNYLKSRGHLNLDENHFSRDNLNIFVVVGGIRPVKDSLYLPKVFSDWHINNEKKAYLVFVGPLMDTDYGQKFLDQVEKSEGVAYVGGLCTEDTHAAIRDSTALVNSSTSEGMATAILEAMDLRTPVIARDIPSNCDIIEHRVTGLLYHQPQDFVRMAELLLTSPNLRDFMTKRAKEQIVAKHCLKTEFEAYSLLVEQSLTKDQR